MALLLYITKPNRLQIVLICILYGIVPLASAQLAFANLTSIGIIPAESYSLKITGAASNQYLVVKLVPNLGNMSECGVSSLNNYKAMLRRLLLPINDSLARIKRAITDRPIIPVKIRENIFWGAVVGGIALGIASTAQITAGIALHNSLQNAAAIYQMKDAIKKTNQAITELQTSTAQTIVAICALQDQINNQFIPAIQMLGCQTVSNSIGLRLNQYFSELSLVFGPNLRNPALETLSIQAISQAFNGDFDTIVKTLGYTDRDLLDLLESNSIRGRIIDVDLDEYYIVIQIEYPSLTLIPDAVIQLFNRITFNAHDGEWVSVFPNQLLVRGGFISAVDISPCTITTHSILCKTDPSFPISETLSRCARGEISQCGKTRVVNTHIPRYALSSGVIFANCLPINCRCVSPEFTINQDPKATSVMITREYCDILLIDSIYVNVGPKVLDRAVYTTDIQTGGEINIDPIDIGNELAAVEDSLNHSIQSIKEAQELLEKVNPNIVNGSTAAVIIIFITGLTAWAVVSLIWLAYLTKLSKISLEPPERQRLIIPNPRTINTISHYGT